MSDEKDKELDVEEKEAEKKTSDKKKKGFDFKSLNKGTKIGIIVAIIVIILALVGGIYCGVTEQNPSEAINTVFGNNDDKIIGNWESDSNPGFSAYVFNDDGTCDQYVLTAVFHWDYEIKGNKLSMVNQTTSKENVYQISISGDQLTMKLVVQDDNKVDNGESLLYNKVDELNQKTLVDVIQNLKEDSQNETTSQYDPDSLNENSAGETVDF